MLTPLSPDQIVAAAEGEPDLGYVGAFSGMKCGNLNEVGDRLECHHSKWKYDDPLANMEARRKALQRRRKGSKGPRILLPMVRRIHGRENKQKFRRKIFWML